MIWLGAFLGFVAASILWALYLAYFEHDATALGKRFRAWLKKKIRFRR